MNYINKKQNCTNCKVDKLTMLTTTVGIQHEADNAD